MTAPASIDSNENERDTLLRPRSYSNSSSSEQREFVGRWSYFVLWLIVAYFSLSAVTVVKKHQVNKAKSVSLTHHSFPPDFVWGAATSSYQVEGAVQEDGRGLSIWDTFCEKPGVISDGTNGDVACDHYHRMEADVQLMKELGLKAYRFSVAWPRILPEGTGKINPEGIAFYNRLIDTLLHNGIEPWVTLFHWDLPQRLEDDYEGWLNRELVDIFGNYASVCFEAFGDRVKHFITFNEAWTVAVNGYNNGIHAPGRSNNPATEPYLAAHHMILAHARAAQIYRTEFAPSQHGLIGMSNCADFRYPFSETSLKDHDAAERAMVFQLGWFADPLWKGEYPDVMRERLGDRLPTFTEEERQEVMGSSDFLGLNHYSSLLAAEPDEIPQYGGYWADIFVDFSSRDSWKQNDMGWSIVPDGCRELLLWISNRYDQPVIYMTENGSAEPEPDLQSALEDHGRRDYFEGYIRACAESIKAGVDLKGYFAWSLLDNFEWQFGYTRRFGLVRVDFASLVRTPKLSAMWFRDTIAARGKNMERHNETV